MDSSQESGFPSPNSDFLLLRAGEIPEAELCLPTQSPGPEGREGWCRRVGREGHWEIWVLGITGTKGKEAQDEESWPRSLLALVLGYHCQPPQGGPRELLWRVEDRGWETRGVWCDSEERMMPTEGKDPDWLS